MKTKQIVIISSVALVIFILIGLIISGYLSWRNNYQNKIYSGVSLGAVDLSGKSYDEAKTILTDKTGEITDAGATFQYGSKKAKIDLVVDSASADLSFPILIFDVDATVNQAFSYNEPRTYLNYLLFTLKPKDQKTITSIYTLDDQKINTLLGDSFKELNIPPENSSFSITNTGADLQISPEKLGKEINYELALTELKANLNTLSNSTITIKTHSKYPDVSANDLGTIKNEAAKIINQDGLYLNYVSTSSSSTLDSWHIKPEKLITWLSVTKNNNSLNLSLDKEKIKTYLSLTVVPEINTEAIRPRYEVIDGKLTNWQKGTNGKEIDLDSSAANITTEFLKGINKIPLVVKDVISETVNSLDEYNIKEIIGTGHSNFVGSTVNRIKNIQVGAASVNGVLLAPGEEFSLVKVLGDVSEQTGYFPELVIKDNKTIPEFGGGLCQVATTIFRSALASGLPITARRNHSYRVSYYEPAGTDAAVYIPNPDVKFLNDTPNYILIQSRIVKNDIYFDFWGTKDGRIATTTTPVIYNITKPLPTKYTETTSLAPGVKKCTERAHNGADAYFDYTVTYPAGSTSTPVVEKRFNSHYVPWREVCLIGAPKAQTSSTTPVVTGTTTGTIIATSTKQ